MYRLARPHEGVLGRVPGLAGMHDVDDYPEARNPAGAGRLPLRRCHCSSPTSATCADAPCSPWNRRTRHFPNSPYGGSILNVEANVEVDITAADGLRDLHRDLAARGVRLGLARVKRDLQIPLERAGLAELIGEDMLFPTLPVAEEAYLAWALANPEPPTRGIGRHVDGRRVQALIIGPAGTVRAGYMSARRRLRVSAHDANDSSA